MTSDEIDSIVQRAESVTGDWDDQEAIYKENGKWWKITFSTNPFKHHNQLISGPEEVFHDPR